MVAAREPVRHGRGGRSDGGGRWRGCPWAVRGRTMGALYRHTRPPTSPESPMSESTPESPAPEPLPSVLTTRVQRRLGEQAVVAVGGPMDFESTPALTELLLGLVEQGHRHLVLEVSQVSFCDSSGLNALVRVLRQAKRSQGSLALVAPTDQVERLLAITSVDSVIAQYPTVALALEGSPPA